MIPYHHVLQDLVATLDGQPFRQIVSCLKMIDVALLQSKTVLLVTSQKRLAASGMIRLQAFGGKGFVINITPFF